jgi:hypothetical protein
MTLLPGDMVMTPDSAHLVRDPAQDEVTHFQVVLVLHHHVRVAFQAHVGEPHQGRPACQEAIDPLDHGLASLVARPAREHGRVKMVAEQFQYGDTL